MRGRRAPFSSFEPVMVVCWDAQGPKVSASPGRLRLGPRADPPALLGCGGWGLWWWWGSAACGCGRGGAGPSGGSAGLPASPGGARPPVGDTAAEVQDLVNRLGALSDASGVYVMRPPAPAPMGAGSSSALPGGLVMVAGVSQASRFHLGPLSRLDVGSKSCLGAPGPTHLT